MASTSQLYSVSLLNDDETPMQFVVDVLKRCFGMSRDDADLLMWRVHTTGAGECGRYPHEVAEQKAAEVMALARSHGHPLKCASAPVQD